MQGEMFGAPKAAPLPATVDLRCCDVVEVLGDKSLHGSAGLVHCDPPWTYSAGKSGRASEHYALLGMADIVSHVDGAYDIAGDDCYMLLWATWPVLAEWMMAAQGIRWEYVSGAAWVKTGRIGIGYHWRGDSEPLLLYRKGKPQPRATIRNAYVSERPSGAGNSGTRHSEKPLEWQARLLEAFSDAGAMVLDVYAGMAPLADACVLTERKYLGAEIDADRHRAAMGLIASGVRR